MAGSALELLGGSRRLADRMHARVIGVLVGEKLDDVTVEAVSAGADLVVTVNGKAWDNYRTETYTALFEALSESLKPGIILFAQDAIGRDLAPALALRLNSAATLDCVELAIDPDSKRLLQTKPIYGGNARAVYCTDSNPQIATVRAKAMAPIEPDRLRKGEIISFDLDLDKIKVRAMLVEKASEQVDGLRLEDARVVVSGGRGLGSPEAFKKLEEAALLLNGTVGASRAACDNGWIPSTKQVGLTGKVVTPELYFAIGISGASQHMAGCHGAGHIIAINSDDGAHIFNEAHYGVLGDWEPVLAGFIKKIRELN